MLSGMPWLMAAARTKSLNVDPAWKPLASPYFFGDGVVEVGLPALLVLAHRAGLGERADVTAAGLDHRQAADGLVGLVDVGGDRVVSGLLHVEVDRGVDRQAAVVQRAATLLGRVAEHRVLQQPVDDVVAEERRPRLLAAVGRRLDVERLRQGLALEPLGLLLGQDAELGHPVEDDVAPALGALGVVDGVVADGVLHEAGKRRRLEQVEVLGVLGEEVARGRLDAEGAVAEVGDVEVALEDPVLAVVLLEGDRVAELADLARVGLLGRGLALLVGLRLVEQRLLDHLLGDRRAALHRAAVGLVGDEGADGALEVEGAVLVEAVVLDRDDRLDHGPRDRGQRHVDAVLVVERGDQVAVDVVDARLLRQVLRLERLGEVDHALADVLGCHADQARERDGEAGDEDTHDDRDGSHHREVGRHATGGTARGAPGGRGRA